VKRAKRGEWTDVTERGPGYTSPAPLTIAFRGEWDLRFNISRLAPSLPWRLHCAMLDLFTELGVMEPDAAKQAAVLKLRRELLRISDDLELAQRKIA
jgi:hypothetical protein